MTTPLRTDGTPIDPRMSPHNEIVANLASLNEIVEAIVTGLKNGETPGEAYADTVANTLRDHNWSLGFEFNGLRPSAADIERLGL